MDFLERLISDGPSEADLSEMRAAIAEDEAAHAANIAQSAAQSSAAAPAPVRRTKYTPRAAQGTRKVKVTLASILDEESIRVHEFEQFGASPPNISPMMSTTIGLSGFFNLAVPFNEAELIKFAQATIRYPCIRAVCNYGDVRTPDFDRLLSQGNISTSSEARAQRARKRKQDMRVTRGIKPRKMQGNGTCFNSSVLFWIYSERHRVVYKVRMFRTGKFGLPGTKPNMIRDIIDMLRGVVAPMMRDMLEAMCAASAIATLQTPELVSLTSIMKNYKFQRKLPPGRIIDLRALRDRVNSDGAAQKIMSASFSGEEAKLALRFAVLVPCANATQVARVVRADVFLSGKVGILGTYDIASTESIRAYIMRLLADDTYVAVIGSSDQ